jgi:hypothetical protein
MRSVARALSEVEGLARAARRRVSPVVKEKSYFAPTIDVQGCEPCRGADLRQCRDPQGSEGVALKLRVAAETGLESNLFSQVPQRVI